MNFLRKVASLRGGASPTPPVDYSDEVTKEDVRRIDDLVKKEIESREWVTVERPA